MLFKIYWILVSLEDISNKDQRISNKFKDIIGGIYITEFSCLCSSPTSLSESILFESLENEFSGIFSIASESIKFVVSMKAKAKNVWISGVKWSFSEFF